MAHDEDLARRVRELIGSEGDLEEKRMFGGIGFMLDGNMAVAASGQGGLLVRVDPEDADRALDEPGASPMQMKGRDVSGWIRVEARALDEPGALESWVERGAARARALAAG